MFKAICWFKALKLSFIYQIILESLMLGYYCTTKLHIQGRRTVLPSLACTVYRKSMCSTINTRVRCGKKHTLQEEKKYLPL